MLPMEAIQQALGAVRLLWAVPLGKQERYSDAAVRLNMELGAQQKDTTISYDFTV